MGGGLSKKKFSKEEKMLKQVLCLCLQYDDQARERVIFIRSPFFQVRQQNELRDKWLSRIENTSCVLSEVGSELDGRYSIEVGSAKRTELVRASFSKPEMHSFCSV